MLGKVAEHNTTPLVISVVAMIVALLALLTNIVILVSSSKVEGRYTEQSAQNQLQGEQIMTLEAYVNSLRIIMTKAGIETPEMPKLPHGKNERK